MMAITTSNSISVNADDEESVCRFLIVLDGHYPGLAEAAILGVISDVFNKKNTSLEIAETLCAHWWGDNQNPSSVKLPGHLAGSARLAKRLLQ